MFYETFRLSAQNPIVSNHSAYGRALLPGLAYIDILFQFFQKHHYAWNAFELRNLSIYHPLIVSPDYDVVLTIQYSEINAEQWQIEVEGQEEPVDGSPAWSKKRYASAEMHQSAPASFKETLDLSQIKAAAQQVLPLEAIYGQCRERDLVHSGIMKAAGEVYAAEAAACVAISLGPEANSSQNGFLFHPALIDGSALGALALLSSLVPEEERLYLPLFYESFRATELLQQRCVTRIQTANMRRNQELLYLTLEFFNEAGQKVAELRNFVSKLVRNAELIKLQRQGVTTAESLMSAGEGSPKHDAAGRAVNSTPTSGVETFLQQLLAERLGKSVDQIAIHVGYYEMGLDSPGLLELVRALQTQVGASLSPTLLFEYTTIAELAAYLTANYAERFSSAPVARREPEPETLKNTIPQPPTKVAQEDIAIIGMAGRYPQADNLREFWENLKAGKDCISEVPASRWDWQAYDAIPTPSGKKLSKWGGFIADPDYFDPQFFRIAPLEAELMDPQERLFLETCWESIEDAGYTPQTLVTPQGPNQRRPVGVFVGVMHKDYTLIGAEAAAQGETVPLSLNYAPIANRVSYFCNFHGPSMAVDTVCSSSLTALHLALESIRHGECEVALAGGVNLSLHPAKYLSYGMMGMHASDGHCHTFGKDGDGYVSGEGVGAVLLKPLQQAIAAGDHIYAVIKGSVINHGGAVSGITVPSPVAQADLIRACFEKTGIDPRTLSYIEAHGTGTSLGDPIEIAGLVKAFRLYTPEKQYCAIGSVKSNIGHAESAAGISALTKVALQLYHQTLVPSLHAEELNPQIDFAQSPFFVQQQTEEWQPLVLEEEGQAVSYPRRAGLSSFGATGSNVHLILEEYHPSISRPNRPAGEGATAAAVIIPLSAKNPERLQAYARKLGEFLQELSVDQRPDLTELAYTLQVGREALEERVAMVVTDLTQLTERLAALGAGQEEVAQCWRGQIKPSQATQDRLTDREALELIAQAIRNGQVAQIAECWVKGFTINWNLFYEAFRPGRISLPTYPFARERYWLPVNGVRFGSSSNGATLLHPLVQHNTSNLMEQRFSSTFSGREFFLSDHVVQQQRILPGVAYLEMARVAVAQATGVAAEGPTPIKLKNVIWVRPITVAATPVKVHIGLFPERNGAIAFEIYSEAETDPRESVVHCQGSAVVLEAGAALVWDLPALQAQCAGSVLTAAQCYAAFEAAGFHYGPAHQGIATVYRGDDRVLAKLVLPGVIAPTLDQFGLHPSLLDSALQASMALFLEPGDLDSSEKAAPLKPALPFALQELEVFGDCPPELWALIRYNDGAQAGDKVVKLDLDLLDSQGQVWVRMQSLSSRNLEGAQAESQAQADLGLVLFQPVWQAQDVASTDPHHLYEQRVVMCLAADPGFPEQIEIQIAGARCLALEAKQSGIGGRFQDYATQLFGEIQNIFKAKPAGKVLLQLVIPLCEEEQWLSGLSGLLKTAQLENPSLLTQLIQIEPGETVEMWIAKLKENGQSPVDQQIRYPDGQRQVACLREIEYVPEASALPWKKRGVYLITGGGGGLALIFAQEIARQAPEASVVLIGRSPLSAERRNEVKQLQELGVRVAYRQVDVTQKKAVANLIHWIQKEWGSLHGIIHSAGVIRDNFIIKKTSSEFQAVLAPKVSGLVNLDHASQDLALDFLILFSSGAGVAGNLGQADYAAANAFMDAYAHYRNHLVANGQRQGRTLTLNWPLWQAGGMRVDAATEKMMRDQVGMMAMQSATGIQALYQGFATHHPQVMVMEGERNRLRAAFLKSMNGNGLTKDPLPEEAHPAVPGARLEALLEKAVSFFKKLLSATLKLPTQRIEADAPLENYGIDSIKVMEMTNQLEKTFGSLPKTLFFEYQTIQDLTGYFLANYRPQLGELLESGNSAIPSVANIPDLTTAQNAAQLERVRRGHARFATWQPATSVAPAPLDIAIIGMAGRYPQAGNLQEFWRNLREGQDCITEIPPERWDYTQYFSADPNQPGKTYSKWGGFIDGVDQFDPLFFNISPREAQIMDPQERLFLQCVYETLEDAGYTREALGVNQDTGSGGNVGVYVGVMYEEYQLYGAQEQITGQPVALSGNPSSIANRVSYFCNFQGPSIAVDTMCSSSLTAIHLACESLRHGGCALAIAGGVNVSLHPNKYLLLGQGKFASSKGRCASFGADGDGYVPGEGVGAVLLKPLAQAEADGDHIYGVIKGSAINHGGKTNGYTVPNPKAQASVIGQALKVAGIDPRMVSYLEAHGTGTALGDPIEIAGLTKTFQASTLDRQFCAIGSAKSNIGHCESAAGIAGVTKILLQLQHRQIAPSLHAAVLNPNIDFSATPFVVQRELAEWKRPVIQCGETVKEYPRIAGISAFGAGGANAHLVIEEYLPKALVASLVETPVIILLSARNEARLQEQVQRLTAAIAQQQLTESDLSGIAYTLQVGREAMNERLAVIVSSLAELAEKLHSWLSGRENIEALYRGQLNRQKDSLAVLAANPELQETIAKWIQRRKYPELLELWVKGLAVDWKQLYSEPKPQRLSLPTYPFARERYWVPVDTAAATRGVGAAPLEGTLHPLLHRNTSDFSEQRFSSVFSGREFFWVADLLNQQRILPGMLCLEMAWSAVLQATGQSSEDLFKLSLRDVVWDRPIVAGAQGVEVHIGLYPEATGEIAYEIYSDAREGATEPSVYSQGKAVPISVPAAPFLERKSCQAACTQASYTAVQLAEILRITGIELGWALQAIQKVELGPGQILVELALPEAVVPTTAQFAWHPSQLEAVLQAVVAITQRPIRPIALETLEVWGRSALARWAVIRWNDAGCEGNFAYQLDLDWCDEQGQVLMRMQGLSFGLMEPAQGSTVNSPETCQTLLLQPCWKAQPLAGDFPAPVYSERVVIFCEPEAEIGQGLANDPPNGMRCLSLKTSAAAIEQRFQGYALELFEIIQSLLAAKSDGKVSVQLILPAKHDEHHVLAGLSALVRTAQLENPKLIGQLIEIEAGETWDGLREKLAANSCIPSEHHIRYQDGQRYVKAWNELAVAPEVGQLPWRERGIYLITGGAGGLGLILAREIAQKAVKATLILTGRSVLDDNQLAALKAGVTGGARIEYQAVDVTDPQGVNDLIQWIIQEYGGLNGIVHSAGILRDNYILKKNPSEFQAVLAPKVSGLVNLDQASRELSLDCFILFSSLAGAFGNSGQADYATANAFMDAYASYRNELVAVQQRSGQTLAINWPLWQAGGMQLDVATEQRMQQTIGMRPLQTATGIATLYQACASGKSQVLVMEGERERMRAQLLRNAPPVSAAAGTAAVRTVEPWLLRDKTLHQLKLLLAEVTKMSVAALDPQEPLESYGIDSVMITQLNQQLETVFGELSKTLFYEYQTLGALAAYLIRDQTHHCLKWTGLHDAAQSLPEKLTATKEANPRLLSLKTRRQLKRGVAGSESADRVAPIAIIGMSGRYPGAENLNEFWENLKTGQDCITEIPPERWSIEGFYDPDPQAALAHRKSYSKWGGFVTGFADFDSLFFGISPREAINLDPQERLFVEFCWQALEDAGYTREQLETHYHRRVGVFAGITKTGFELYGPDLWHQGEKVHLRSSFGSVANRISYLLNLQGPSLPIDTMCSSSLTAIHEACEHLYRGECELAIAGGVNLYLHPANYIDLCNMQMLSPDGHCKSFGLGGNGFVPGEGVGVLLLKPLARAIADGDHIHAVIRGTSINHGGKTNGYTVPNPVAQGEVIRAALDQASVDARTVSYIEAHGTGTELGDPIEISGLNQAFQTDTLDTGFCAIGSVKSNIGHLEAAAGMAGIAKIVLQMKHQQLVPSLHAENLNPNINFAKTPFLVQRELSVWQRPIVEKGGRLQEYPRIAGISSFGAGGANAHIVLEEYLTVTEEANQGGSPPHNPVLIVLSAKNEARLQQYAQQLAAALEQPGFTDAHLTAIAYTLQVGREAMDERLGLLAGTLPELNEKLRGFVAGREGIADLFRGQAKRNQAILAALAQEEEMQETVAKWMQRRKYAKILDLWVKGFGIDWSQLYDDPKPRRMSLPTYPFAKERYWLPKTAANRPTPVTVLDAIHPLLQQNTSNLSGQQFTACFTGTEFFLADHRVKGQTVFPEAAYLEMARAAVEQASSHIKERQSLIRLKQIVWAQPLVVSVPSLSVQIGLYPDGEQIAYEIVSQPEGSVAIVHNQGVAWVSDFEAVPSLDLAVLQTECPQTDCAAIEQFYQEFKRNGLDYGPAYRGLEQLYRGPNQILAKFSLPAAVAQTRAQFGLHPSIIEAALQAAFNLVNTANQPISLAALEQLEIFTNSITLSWARIRFSGGSKPETGLPKLDIDLCDDQGQIGVRMQGLSFRLLTGELGAETLGKLLLEPSWKPQPLARNAEVFNYAQHWIFLCELDQIAPEAVAARIKPTQCLALCSSAPIEERFKAYAMEAFETIQGILKEPSPAPVLLQIVVASHNESQLCSGLAGLLKTARLENPKLVGQLIEVEAGANRETILAQIEENRHGSREQQIRYQDGQRWVHGWSEVAAPSVSTAMMPWRDQGIYLITGGAGGLGLIFAQEIARQVKAATLILTGRSMLGAAQQAKLQGLRSSGFRIEYRQVDVTQAPAVESLIRWIQTQYGKLHGIIHSAGLIQDNFILKKTPAEFGAVLAPKVNGAVNLDQASRELQLDFFVLFSSLAGPLGNLGQADYATGNAFMDAYAVYRNALVASRQRQGRTLAINWPLWKEGGMQIDRATEALLQESGLSALQTASGIEALYQSFAAGKAQVAVLEGNLSRLRELWLSTAKSSAAVSAENHDSPEDSGSLREKLLQQLKLLFGKIAELEPGKIAADEFLENYGINSIMITQLNQQLAGVFGEVSKTLFFEYRTLDALSEYLTSEYPQACRKWTGLGEALTLRTETAAATPRVAGEFPLLVSLKERAKSRCSSLIQPRSATWEPIAIIGLSGRYAQARTLAEFWENLKTGQDCITEIPEERWALDGFYHPDPQEAVAQGKSYSKWGSFLDGFADFDPLFFNISPREASNMDPQERLFIQVCWAVLEDAGYTREQLATEVQGRVGVFAGVTKIGFNLHGPDLWRAGAKVFPHTSFASIANRVSYLLNLQGPSMPVDTMCSSSLTAIHEACEHLQRQECELAIAGGVNLYLHPSSYIGLCGQKMLSASGKCHSFGQDADGFVPGEGVGAVLLKPLSRAVEDGDHIYGVIRATSINHGGKTNGFTVPNPAAQRQLIRAALDKAGLNARAISYLEAHGTGTELGDPIEITGLSQAFGQDTRDTAFCALGSVKSNLGHLEAAAGIAGVTKILLQMQHGQLVPSLHAAVLNPNINFARSPFVLQQELAKWHRPVVGVDGATRELPRIAGISSFGAGGANAHILIEEYLPPDLPLPAMEITPQNPALIVLSAQNEERLLEQAQQLLAAIRGQAITESQLADLAYTLQIGREAMDERLGFIAGSLRELETQLADFVNGQLGSKLFYRGQVKRNKDVLAGFSADEDLAKVIAAWIEQRKYAKLLDLWVKGLTVDWKQLYGSSKPRRMSLPTYPFARETYWLPWPSHPISGASAGYVVSLTGLSPIHPLVQQNTSDFFAQRFSSTFTGQEFFLADHRVKGERMLPGMAFLEMARAAVEQAAGVGLEVETGIRIKNVTWIRPLSVGPQPVKVQIELFAEDSGVIQYEISSETDGADAQPVIHSQGSAVLSPLVPPPLVDLTAFQIQCNQILISGEQCYATFAAMGVEYGPAHRGIEALYLGQDRVMAKLVFPAVIADTQGQFGLHPSLLDAASQASIGLIMGGGDPDKLGGSKPALPFALEELEIYPTSITPVWAVVRSQAGNKVGDQVLKLDLDLCDATGAVSVRLKGFSLRVLKDESQPNPKPIPIPQANPVELPVIPESSPAVGTLTLTPVWDAVAVAPGPSLAPPSGRVLVCGGSKAVRGSIKQHYPQARFLELPTHATIDAIVKKLADQGSIDHVWWIAPATPIKSVTENTVIQGQSQGVILLFRLIKALLRLEYGARDLGWTVITFQAQDVLPNEVVNPTHASIHGLIGSMAKEYANWQVRLIDLVAEGEWPLTAMASLPADRMGNAWAYRGLEWYRQKLVSCHFPVAPTTLYRSGGVYVVIGGSGGIGEVWTEYMIRTYQAQVIWIGRRSLDETIQSKLNRLAGLGPAPSYIVADATNPQELQQAYATIKRRHAQIHGLLHSAIVLLDKSLANMDEDRFRAGLAAKVDVSVRLAQVFQQEPLDFVLFFSSTTSFVKASGQSNYAAGCTFKDAFARQLAQEWPAAVKVMNWGYWGSFGVAASSEYQARMAKAGIGSIEPPEAMEALEALLAGPRDRIALLNLTKPMTLEGMNAEEILECYPQEQPSSIQNLRNYWEKAGLATKRLELAENPYAQEIEQQLVKLLWVQLQTLGLFDPQEASNAASRLTAGLPGWYQKWLSESIAVLVRHHYLQYQEGAYRVIDAAPNDSQSVWEEWDRRKGIWMDDPNTKAQVTLVETTLRALSRILTGKVTATEIMFPDSSLEVDEGVYKNNRMADYFNEALADTVAVYLEMRRLQDPSAQVRILEIGAGTGGASFMIFQKVEPYRELIQEYCYTDISQAFLMHAQKEYGPAHPYLTYQLFNVAEPLAGQGIAAGKYDLVIATNVLHATPNIRQTLRNAKAALKRNGLLLINEISGNALFTHLTFGLLEGWWLYEDAALRIPGCPGLYPESWKNVLHQEGFQSVFFPVPEAHPWGQQIIVAESDGVVWQKPVPQVGMADKSTLHRVPATASQATVTALKAPQQSTAGITPDGLREKATGYLTQLIGETLQISSYKLDPAEPLEKYGIDSIVAIQLSNALGKVFTNIGSTFFFEYPTIEALTEYLISHQQATLRRALGLAEAPTLASVTNQGLDATPMLESLAAPSKLAQGRSLRFLANRNPEKSEVTVRPTRPEIAIIGIAGRYPGAENLEEFWQNLCSGRDCITEIPPERWDYRRYFDPDRQTPGKTYCKWGGFLDGVDQFDPLFFNISPRDAELMDPMSRLFLENVWNLFETAGYTREALQRDYQSRVGVYVGAMYQQYQSFHSDIVREAAVSTASYSAIANRVSHFFNLQGPSIAVDTMCSSSTIAIHMACESLAKGECQLAVAGGVNLSIHPKKYLGLSLTQMLGSHCNSRSFGVGDGFLPAEGVGALLLKPLALAVRDRDDILAVIKSTAINHNGHSNGYSVPNPNAQAQLIEENFTHARIDPRTISYVEAAANGSALGDPLEVTALSKAFQKFTADQQFCAIGSVKSNIGHAEAASGISQISKVVLQLRHRQLVPSIKAEPLNPNLHFENTPFYLQRELQEWRRLIVTIDGVPQEVPRRATVSSFGAGGSNAHLIIEEYLPQTAENHPPAIPPTPQLLVFSAQNRERLQAMLEQMSAFMERQTSLNLPDLAYTLQVGREAMEFRLALVVRTLGEVRQGLQEALKGLREGESDVTAPSLFIGNPETDRSTIKQLLSGKFEATMVQMLLEERNLEKIALYWTQGGKIPWAALHEGAPVRKLLLPTYPFAKRRCWIESPPELEGREEAVEAFEQVAAIEDPQRLLEERIAAMVARVLGMGVGELNLQKPLVKYGVDSIGLMSLFQQLQTQVDPLLSLEQLTSAPSAQAIIDLVRAQTGDAPIPLARPKRGSTIRTKLYPATWPQFPELVHLNRSFQGRPVFWFHGALGGSEVYQRIAQRIPRPFYAIQARGWMTERVPAQGIYAMAAYYVHIIQSVQPEGPYDLGGYSMGGTLAYEVTRQLQELGQTVNSIVMLDSMYCAEVKQNYSTKTLLLQMVNIALAVTVKQAPEKIVSTLIHRDEIDFELEAEPFLEALIKLAQTRGVTKPATQLHAQIQQSLKVRQAYKFDEFLVWPLPEPQAVTCYYFRNQSGIFWGGLEPYFTSASEAIALDQINYWEEWERQLPKLTRLEVDSANHMTVLADQSFETIAAFCERFYAV